MAKFRKLPVDVQALRFDGTFESIEEIARHTYAFSGGVETTTRHNVVDGEDVKMPIRYVEFSSMASGSLGDAVLYEGDWLVNDPTLGLTSVDPENFRKQYEAVSL